MHKSHKVLNKETSDTDFTVEHITYREFLNSRQIKRLQSVSMSVFVDSFIRNFVAQSNYSSSEYYREINGLCYHRMETLYTSATAYDATGVRYVNVRYYLDRSDSIPYMHYNIRNKHDRVPDILHNNSSSEEALRINTKVQPQASLILMSKSFIESIFPSFLSLFLGPWSDKYGRKPVILSGYIGISLTYLLLSMIANWEIVPWYFLIAYIPMALLGGISVLMLASFCYITDITDNNERAWHLAWLDALISLGVLIGLFSGPAVYEAYGYTAVFSVATVLCIVATLYILLFIPETVQSHTSGICDIFDFVFVKDLINTCIKKRDGFNRSLVWSCLACLTLLLIAFQGNLAIGYLFASARLGWTVDQFSTYVATNVLVGILGTIFGVKLIRRCTGFSEAVVVIISVMSSFCTALVCAFTWQSWHMYLSVSVGIFGDLSRPMIRTILSKAVPEKDTGKVFSLATFLETLLPFAAASLYTFLYSHYMPPSYPLPVWFLSAAFYIITIIILIYIQIHMRRNIISFTPMIEDNDSTQ